MPKPKLKNTLKFHTTSQVSRLLSLSRYQIELRIKQEVFPVPSSTDPDSGVRYFDEDWISKAREVLTKLNVAK